MLTPLAATRNATEAACQCSVSPIALAVADAKLDTSASPAMPARSPDGAALEIDVTARETGPNPAYVAPATAAAIQRRDVSAPASGPAESAAAIAERLMACPPRGAPTTVATPVYVRAPRIGGR